ncbi:DUF6122 family protein [Flagellimonas sp. S3867]|uniref:DUF6122 family protein n=1 Tax=Flagellimonas sp. S3867 TaxID=2768063 RepID=UPI0016847112|nr:DUF6122 family protein [Flagellimonas sp. S3867]
MFRFFIHYGIHLLVPVLIAFFFFKERRFKVILILLAGMLIDLDHLLADPIFDPNRCSIGFHPLHSYIAIIIYSVLPFFKWTRLLGLGLIIHIVADMVDCLLI